MPADLQRALGHVVQARDELHETGFGRARAADDADHRARGDVKVDVVKHRLLRVARVAEGHVVEFDGAVRHMLDRVVGVGDGAALLQHLADTLGGRLRDDEHDEHHRDHHERHEDLQRVGHQCGQVAGGQAVRRIVPGGHDLLRTHPGHREQGDVDARVHKRGVEAQYAFRLDEITVDGAGDAAELLDLMVFAVVRLDHADALEVLIHVVVELVIGMEDALENRVHQKDDREQRDAENRDDRKIYQRNRLADAERADPCGDHHDRGAHADADDHLVGVLQVGHIGGAAGDDRAGGETVDIREAEALHLGEHVVAEVLREARGGDGGEPAGKRAGGKRDERAQEQDQAEFPHGRHGAAGDALVDEVRHDRRDDDFHNRLNGDGERGEQAFFLVFAQAVQQGTYDVRGFRRCIGGGARSRGCARGHWLRSFPSLVFCGH